MSYGVIEYNIVGQPKCEICGEHFDRVLAHVRQKHNMDKREYKETFGFDSRKGICSSESSQRSREVVERNLNIIYKNLQKGAKYRYEKGHKGRTKDQVSEQTKLRLKARLKQPYMVEAMSQAGKVLAASGLGNAIRWGKKESD
jgi:hypothetical protein